MDLKSAIDIIIKDLRESCDIIDDLKKYPGVPVWQVELAKSKCKSAGELIALLKDLRDTESLNGGSKQVIDEKPVFEGFTVEKKTEAAQVIDQEKRVISVEVTEQEKKIVTAEVMSPEIISHPATEKSEVKKEEPGQNGKKPFESATIADQFSNKPSYNEQLGGHMHEGDVFERLKTTPVTDLAEAIGLNDKFLFVREIFNGSHDKYNQAISRIASVRNLQEAKEVIQDYAGDTTDKEVVKLFLDIVKRKFPSNE